MTLDTCAAVRSRGKIISSSNACPISSSFDQYPNFLFLSIFEETLLILLFSLVCLSTITGKTMFVSSIYQIRML